MPGDTLKPSRTRSRHRHLRIEGGVIGTTTFFDDNGFGDGWTLDNLPYGYSRTPQRSARSI